jgi:flagellar motor switch protein FliM
VKPERTLIAERPLAQHCLELLRPAPGASELLPALAQVGDALARGFAAGLAKLSGGDMPAARCLAPRECTMAELAQDIAPLAANCLMMPATRHAPFLASIEAGAVLRMVDRAFGGRGQVPSPLPDAFPMSAELLIARLESIVSAATGQVLGLSEEGAIRTVKREGCLDHLAPFPAATPLIALTLEVHEAATTEAWKLTLAFPIETATELLGAAQPAPKAGPRVEANAKEEPFGDVPLAVTAVLVDMRIAFSQLAQLRPGQIIPVAVARSVPLKVADKVIAHGSIGEVDDRVAVQITHAF